MRQACFELARDLLQDHTGPSPPATAASADPSSADPSSDGASDRTEQRLAAFNQFKLPIARQNEQLAMSTAEIVAALEGSGITDFHTLFGIAQAGYNSQYGYGAVAVRSVQNCIATFVDAIATSSTYMTVTDNRNVRQQMDTNVLKPQSMFERSWFADTEFGPIRRAIVETLIGGTPTVKLSAAIKTLTDQREKQSARLDAVLSLAVESGAVTEIGIRGVSLANFTSQSSECADREPRLMRGKHAFRGYQACLAIWAIVWSN